jgi:hypothetical protein
MFGILIEEFVGDRVSWKNGGEQGTSNADDQGKPEAHWRLA